MSNFTGLSVGRIVHFFTTDKAKHSNGQGEGPYPAIVLQTFGDGTMGNLKVMTWDGDRTEGSVSEKEAAEKKGETRWYVWPPRT